jgi:hypothetical protein
MTEPLDIVGLQMKIIQEGIQKESEKTEGVGEEDGGVCGYDTGAHIREWEDESDFMPEPHTLDY